MPNFPSSLDSLANPTSSTYTDDSGFELDVVVSQIHDILEALEAKLGVGASVAAANQVLRGTGAGATSFGTIDASYLDSRTRSIWLPATQFVAALATPTAGVLSNVAPYWSFPDTPDTDTAVVTSFAIPKDWASGSIAATLYWTMPTGGAGGQNARFQVGGLSLAVGEAVTVNYSTAVSVNGGVTADRLGKTVLASNITASIAVDEISMLAVKRVASDTTNDTLTQAVRMLGVLLEYTADM